jgi:hypothetical protein
MILSARDRRALTIVGLGLVVVVTAYMLFFAGGTNHTGSGAFPGSSVNGAAQQLPGQTPAAAKAPLLIFTGRDPFLPLIQASSAPSSQPTVSPAGSGNPSPGGGSSTSIGGHTVVLDSIFTVNGVQKVQVEVDGKVYTVAPGGSFAGNFKLVSINGSCANFTFGDQAFTLCLASNK